MELNIEKINIENLKPNKYNPNKMSFEQLESLKKNILEYGYIQPIIVCPTGNANEYEIIDGEQRYTVLNTLIEENNSSKYKTVPCVVLENKTALTEARKQILTLSMNDIYGDNDIERLLAVIHEIENEMPRIHLPNYLPNMNVADLKLEEIECEYEGSQGIAPSIYDKASTGGTAVEHALDVGDNMVSESGMSIKEIFDKVDKIYYSFSGGKDSTLAYYLTRKEAAGHERELVFSETGVEIPDIITYVVQFAEFMREDLVTVHPTESMIKDLYFEKQFPHVVRRSCISRLILAPIMNHISAEGFENVALIKGGARGQLTQVSKADFVRKYERGTQTIYEVNPLINLSEREVNDISNSFKNVYHFWSGYERGYNRTACWCCPFQRRKQYDILKKEYPILYNRLVEIAKMVMPPIDPKNVASIFTQMPEVMSIYEKIKKNRKEKKNVKKNISV